MKHRLLLLFLPLLSGISCSEMPGGEDSASSQSGKTRVAISATQSDTRTALGEDGRTTEWSIGDSIAIWATNESGPVLNAEPFALYTYNGFFSSADFSASITPMSTGTYTYHAVYPRPASHTGTHVTYELPAIQNGTYEGANDILVAAPVTGPELGPNPNDQLILAFRHLLHMIRIEIPKDRNLFGEPVKRLEITFPTEVSGTVSFDAADPDNTLAFSGGSRTLTLDFEGAGLTDTDGAYACAFVRPGEMNGQITFRAYNAAGYQAKTISTTIGKTLHPGRVTPIDLTIPTARPIINLDFTVASNHLGEELTAIHLTAPDAIRFAIPFSAEGDPTATAPRGEGGIFRTKIYTDAYSTATFAGKTFSIDYESESALLKRKSITLPANIPDQTVVTSSMDVPYLMQENFDNVQTFNADSEKATANPSGVSLDQYGLPSGWWGARLNAEAGKAVRIVCRHELVAQYPGRIDSAPLDIKSGKSVKVQVNFKSGKNNKYFYCTVGCTTKTGGFQGNEGVEAQGQDLQLNEVSGLSFSNIPNSYNFTLTNCSSETRITWTGVRTYNFTGNGFSSTNYYMFLDDITVQIVK